MSTSSSPPPGGVVYLIGRRSNRRILNADEVLETIRTQPGVNRTASRIIFFEGLRLAQQMELALTARAMVGVDGSGFLNGFWMPRSSTAVYIMPYGNRYARVQLGFNFFNLMRAVGVTVHQIHVDDPSASSLPSDSHCLRCILCAQQGHQEEEEDQSALKQYEIPHHGNGTAKPRCEGQGDDDDLWPSSCPKRHCIDNQDTTITASLMDSVASAVRSAVQANRSQGPTGGLPDDPLHRAGPQL